MSKGLFVNDSDGLRRSSERCHLTLNSLRRRGGKVFLLAENDDKESLTRNLAEIGIFPPSKRQPDKDPLVSWGQYDELIMVGVSGTASWFGNGANKLYWDGSREIYIVGGYTDSLRASTVNLKTHLAATAKLYPFYIGPQHNRRVDAAGVPIFPADLEDMEKIELLDGGTGTAYSFEKEGKKYVVKFPSQATQHAFPVELLAEAILRLFPGISVPEACYYDFLTVKAGVSLPNVPLAQDVRDRRLYRVTPFMEGLNPLGSNLSDDLIRSFEKGFIADVLLAIWDIVVQGKNIFSTSDGKVWRLDLGGSFMFRARGGLKDKADTCYDPQGYNLNDAIQELHTMRGLSYPGNTKLKTSRDGAKFYRNLTDNDISAQIRVIFQRPTTGPDQRTIEEKIFDLVGDYDRFFGLPYIKIIRSMLKCRLNSLKRWYYEKNPPVIGAAAAPLPTVKQYETGVDPKMNATSGRSSMSTLIYSQNPADGQYYSKNI